MDLTPMQDARSRRRPARRMGGLRGALAVALIVGVAPIVSAAPPGGWRMEARPPSGAPVKRGEGEDLRDTIARNAPTVIKGAIVVVVVTLAVMTLILVPLGWARRFVARQEAKSGGLSFPSPKKYYVKVGVLGVPSEYEWDLPDLVVGGNRFDMRLSKRAKGAEPAWDLQSGARVEFVLKEEVEMARARHAAEEAERRAATQAWRKFESTFGEPPPE